MILFRVSLAVILWRCIHRTSNSIVAMVSPRGKLGQCGG